MTIDGLVCKCYFHFSLKTFLEILYQKEKLLGKSKQSINLLSFVVSMLVIFKRFPRNGKSYREFVKQIKYIYFSYLVQSTFHFLVSRNIFFTWKNLNCWSFVPGCEFHFESILSRKDFVSFFLLLWNQSPLSTFPRNNALPPLHQKAPLKDFPFLLNTQFWDFSLKISFSHYCPLSTEKRLLTP